MIIDSNLDIEINKSIIKKINELLNEYQPYKSNKLFVLENYLINLINLYDENKLPNKILLSGQKGIRKSTLAFHFINYVLSKEEELAYDLKSFTINLNNKSFILTKNKSNQNFILIDLLNEKKNIDLPQIRELISNLNKSSFNNKPKFILIDNIEFLNKNSINALLKTLEEPKEKIYFILINNDKKILSTLSSRCLNFRISLSNEKKKKIIKQLIGNDLEFLINPDLLNYYSSPGTIYKFIEFSNLYNIDLTKLSLKISC